MIDIDAMHDELDIAAKAYPIKALAPEIGKAESTLRNELAQQDGYKLGLLTSVNIMRKTYNYKALDIIEAHLGRVAFTVPRAERGENISTASKGMADISKEMGETMEEFSKAIADGVVSAAEAGRLKKEIDDLIKSCIQMNAFLDQVIKIKEMV